jgi:SAM-dependent methyltransferase
MILDADMTVPPEELAKFYNALSSSVIEIGCGFGDSLNAVKPAYGAGIDINPHLITKAKEKYPQLDFYLLDIETAFFDLPKLFNSEKFDYIIISDLIGTLEDIQKVFEKMKDISHSRTKIIVTYHNYFWNPVLKIGEKLDIKQKEGVKNWLYLDEIQNLLYLSGYSVVKKGSLLLLPFKIPLISKFFNRYIAKLPLFRRLCLIGFVIGNRNINELPAENKLNSVTVLVPCRNEEGNIEEIVQRTPQIGSHTEIIFVEGNSTDNTYARIEEVIQKYPDKDIKLFRQEGKGKGDAVRKGFDNASCDILMILDADMTVPPEELAKFYNALSTGKGEFINGTRLIYQMEDKAMRPLNKLGNIFFSKVFSWLLEQRITDTLCGTKVLYRKDYINLINNRKYFGEFDPFGDFDLLFGAAKLNLKIIEIPIRYGERKYGTTNINRFRDGFLLLRMCIFALKKIKFVN